MCDIIDKITEMATNSCIGFVSVLPLSHHYGCVCPIKQCSSSEDSAPPPLMHQFQLSLGLQSQVN